MPNPQSVFRFPRSPLRAACLLAGVGMITACATPPETQELLAQNERLQGQIDNANQRINELEAENRLKQQDIDELNRVLNVLDTEKTSRVEESSELRSQVRGFVQQQIDSLKQFLVASDLLDYIGGELVERSQIEDKSLLLVDLANPVPRNGTLTGVGTYITNPTPFVVKVLRPAGNNLVVVWESRPIVLREPGMQRVEFPVTVGLEKGDYIGYYFPETVGVSFDEGTGNTRYVTRDIELGDTIRRSSLLGEDKKRAYSIGVYGLLN